MTSSPISWIRRKPEIASHDIVTRAVHKLGSFDVELADRAEPLEVLCRSLDAEANLTIAGRRSARQLLVSIMAARPAISAPDADNHLERPMLIVTGLSGSGAHALALALGATPGATRSAEAGVDMGMGRATRAAESALVASSFEHRWHVPSYAEWLADRDPSLTAASILHRIGAPPIAGDYDVIYSPQLLEFPATVLELRSNAVILQVRRDLDTCAEAVAASSVQARRTSSTNVDPAKVARYWTWRLQLTLDRNLEQRTANPNLESRIIDVDGSDLDSDAQDAVSAICTRLGVSPLADGRSTRG